MKNNNWKTLGDENFEDDEDGNEMAMSPSRENNNLKNIHINTEMNRGTINKSEFKIFSSNRKSTFFNQIKKLNQSESNKIIGLNNFYS